MHVEVLMILILQSCVCAYVRAATFVSSVSVGEWDCAVTLLYQNQHRLFTIYISCCVCESGQNMSLQQNILKPELNWIWAGLGSGPEEELRACWGKAWLDLVLSGSLIPVSDWNQELWEQHEPDEIRPDAHTSTSKMNSAEIFHKTFSLIGTLEFPS